MVYVSMKSFAEIVQQNIIKVQVIKIAGTVLNAQNAT